MKMHQRLQLASFTSITELDANWQGLVSFPASLCALTGLKKLNLYMSHAPRRNDLERVED